MDVVLRRQETTAERHTCELRVLIASIVRAPPKRASGESFSPLTKDLHGCRPTGSWPETGLAQINGDLLEVDFWPTSLRARLRGRQTFGHINVVVGDHP